MYCWRSDPFRPFSPMRKAPSAPDLSQMIRAANLPASAGHLLWSRNSPNQAEAAMTRSSAAPRPSDGTGRLVPLGVFDEVLSGKRDSPAQIQKGQNRLRAGKVSAGTERPTSTPPIAGAYSPRTKPPETNRPKSHSGQKRSPRRPKRSRKSPPTAGFSAVSGKSTCSKDCVVVDAAPIEPVSPPKFPINREIDREFCRFRLSGAILASS
jgi:hypothetical protein